jgi:hypothetical protein
LLTEKQAEHLARTIVEVRGRYESAVRGSLRYLAFHLSQAPKLSLREKWNAPSILHWSAELLPSVRRLDARDITNFVPDLDHGQVREALTSATNLVDGWIRSGQLAEALSADELANSMPEFLQRLQRALESSEHPAPVLLSFLFADGMQVLSQAAPTERFDEFARKVANCARDHMHRFVQYKDDLLPLCVGTLPPQANLTDPRMALDLIYEFVEATQEATTHEPVAN